MGRKTYHIQSYLAGIRSIRLGWKSEEVFSWFLLPCMDTSARGEEGCYRFRSRRRVQYQCYFFFGFVIPGLSSDLSTLFPSALGALSSVFVAVR